MMRNLLLPLLCFLSVGLPAQSFRTQAISVFKNGIAFFDKSATLEPSAGKILLTDLPFSEGSSGGTVLTGTDRGEDTGLSVLFGTLFFSAPGNELQQVRTWWRNEATQAPLDGLGSLLAANPGKEVRLQLRNRAEPLQGYIEPSMSAGAGYLVLRAAESWHTVPLGMVEDVEFLEEPRLLATVERSRPSLELILDKPVGRQEIRLMYLQRGITWTPQYLLELTGGNTARLTLQAGLANDAEDLTGVDVNFVVGVPAFLFSFASDPLFSSQTVAQLLRSLQQAPQQNEVLMANAITSQRMAVQNDDSSFGATDLPGGDQAGEDLFFYRREKITLPRGGRMQVRLLQTDLRYEDIYSVELSGNEDKPYYYQQPAERENQVWHALQFRNETNTPLTTGSILFLQRGGSGPRPLSQNQLDFTPAGAKARVKMTVVPDIGVRDREVEVDRQRNARDNDDLVTVEATIEIANFKDRAVTLEVTRSLTGDPLDSNMEWQTEADARRLSDLNKRYRLRWEVPLPAGERREITYRYQVYLD